MPEFIDPRFRENKPKTLVFCHRKRAFWACFRENCVYNFGHRGLGGGMSKCREKHSKPDKKVVLFTVHAFALRDLQCFKTWCHNSHEKNLLAAQCIVLLICIILRE